jgi:hypothetical protein
MPIPTDSFPGPAPAAKAPPAAPAPTESAGPAQFDPLSGLLAILFPGAGHWRRGARGVLISTGILGLFLGGLLIGGLCVVDRRDNPIWFAGQALVGPLAFGVDYYNDHSLKVIDPYTGQHRTAHPERRDATGAVIDPAERRGPDGRPVGAAPGQPPQSTQSLGRMNELGTLFCTIAGMLNLIVIIDAAFNTRRAA